MSNTLWSAAALLCVCALVTAANAAGFDRERGNPESYGVLQAPPPMHLSRTPVLDARHARVVQCTPPSAGMCASPLYRLSRCGKLAMAAARVDPEAPCNVALGERAEDLAAQLPVREVALRPVQGLGGSSGTPPARSYNDCVANSGHTCARKARVRVLGNYARGMTSVAYGSTLKAMSYLPNGNNTLEATFYKQIRAAKHAAWNANGVALGSCEEYVFEKYYDYNLFEIEAAENGNTPRAVYDAAYGWQDNPASIGTRAIAGIPMTQKDGVTPIGTIEFPTNQYENVFFQTPVVDPEALVDIPDESYRFDLPCMNRKVSVHRVLFDDVSLLAIIRDGPRHDESFAWHKQMNDMIQDQNILDEELYELDNLKREFAELLAARERLVKAWFAYLKSIAQKKKGQMMTTIDPFVDIIDAPQEAWNTMIAAELAGAVIMPAGNVANTAFHQAFIPPADFENLDIPETQQEVEAGIAQISESACLALAGSMALSPIEGFVLRFGFVDQAIEDALQVARGKGCLDYAPGPCDWSPMLFAQRVTDLFVTEREDDFQQCMDYTANDFEALKNKTLQAPPNQIICSDPNFGSSTHRLEDYFVCVDEWVDAVLADLIAKQGNVFDPATGKLFVGGEGGDVYQMGGSYFGANFTYDTNWRVDGFDGQPAATQAQAEVAAADLSVRTEGRSAIEVSLFGLPPYEVMGARFKMTTQQADVDMVCRFGGSEVALYGEDPEQEFAQNELHPVQDSQRRDEVFVSHSIVVPVLGIPLRVSGGISGFVGMDYHATALRQQSPFAHQMVAGVTPVAGIDAYASASVDLAILEAGVKGGVAIVHMSMPSGTGVSMATPPETGELTLITNSSAQLELGMLSGYMAVFGEIDTFVWSESVEIPIFHWGGVTNTHDIYVSDYSVQMRPLFIISQSDTGH